MKPSPDDDSFSMYAACGPYTSDTNLSYKPWDAFMQVIRRVKPSVLTLVCQTFHQGYLLLISPQIGPFVDTAHPLLQSGEIDEAPLDLFYRIFLDPLRDFLTLSPGSIVILVPSVRDLIGTHAVYPQCEFSNLVTKSDPVCQFIWPFFDTHCSITAHSTCSKSWRILNQRCYVRCYQRRRLVPSS